MSDGLREEIEAVVREHVYVGHLTNRASCDCNWIGPTNYPSAQATKEHAEHVAEKVRAVLAANATPSVREYRIRWWSERHGRWLPHKGPSVTLSLDTAAHWLEQAKWPDGRGPVKAVIESRLVGPWEPVQPCEHDEARCNNLATQGES